MRIAAVLDTWFVSGPGRQLAALSNSLKSQGVELRIFMFQRTGRAPAPFVAYLVQLGVDHTIIPEAGAFDLELPARLARELSAWNPDIVQSHGYRPTALIALLRSRGKRWPWIGFFHGDTFENIKVRCYNRINRALLPYADRIVVLSDEHKRIFSRHTSKVRLIYNASLTLPSGPAASQTPIPRDGSQSVIGTLSRLSPEKGIDLLLSAMRQLLDKGVVLSLAIAGDGSEENNLRRQAASLGLADRVHFLGRIDDVVSFYRSIDLFVLPSRPGSEGLPNAILEAIREDVPVVASAVAAVPEVLSEPFSGVLIAPNSIEAIAQGISEALNTGRNAQAVAARLRVTERFSLERKSLAHLRLYQELVNI